MARLAQASSYHGNLFEPLECSVLNQRREASSWRVISRPDFGLAAVISDAISGSEAVIGNTIRSLRRPSSLLMFSDYGGAHKNARYEVYSYLVITPASLSVLMPSERGYVRPDWVSNDVCLTRLSMTTFVCDL